ncbi:type II toxin-antitoxin system RelE/ParE family toxin [Alicyclobacillaceae bacterium I2511]|nr:type II toxin-antitoxin system RelE/ParE family toxin [Alicyclobacillaceae bacterium I2511]
MKTYNVVISEIAETDLREMVQYIALERMEPFNARHLLSRIQEAILELEKMPYRYALVRDERLASQGIRMLPVDNHIVFYIVSERNNSVTIVRILYGKREWRQLL